MKIYLDADYKCHVENDGTMTPYETDAFDGKCRTYIEGFRIIPAGSTWNGRYYPGEAISAWRDFELLRAAQTGYEDSLREASAAYQKGVNSI